MIAAVVMAERLYQQPRRRAAERRGAGARFCRALCNQRENALGHLGPVPGCHLHPQPPEYVGTGLTIQTSLGFMLTMGSSWVEPIVSNAFDCPGAFLMLAAGPLVGIVAMLSLRRLPEAAVLAGGKRCRL